MRRRWFIAAVMLVLALLLLASWGRLRGESSPLWGGASAPTTLARPKQVLAERKLRQLQRTSETPAGRRGDPLDRLLVREDGDFGAIVEVAAILSSTIGAALASCLGLGERHGELAALEAFGLDPVRSVQRMAIFQGGVVFSGEFASAGASLAAAGRSYGAQGHLVEVPQLAPSGFGVAGAWGDGVLFLAKDEVAARRTIDRLEDRLPPGTPLVPEGEAYGDLYGSVPAKALAATLGMPEGAPPLGPSAAIFHADAQNQLYQTVELPIGPTESARLKAQLDTFLTNRRLAARQGPSSYLDQHLEAAIDGVSVSESEDGLQVEAAFPTEHIQAVLAACRIGLPHPAPPGWSTATAPLPSGFSGPPPPGMVSVSKNQAKLATTFPGLASIMASLGAEQDTWIDPASLQMMTFNHRQVPGICARKAKIEADPRFGQVRVVKDSRDRTWHRTFQVATQPEAGSRTVSYALCKDDSSWEVNVVLQRFVLEQVAFGRLESYLAELQLEP